MLAHACLLVALARAALGGLSPNALRLESILNDAVGGWGANRYSSDIVEDALLDAPGLARKYGYPVEVHRVVTEDGYILEAHRIPHGRDAHNQPGPRPVVFIMHGLLCSSGDFLVLGPGRALAYVLADAGYDVWLGNARGNYYSRRHMILNPDSQLSLNFWKFGWDEIGNLDLPALVDHILATTRQRKMHYVGFSQGGTAFLVLNSLRPEYNDKFYSFQGLAPQAHIEHNENDFREFFVQFERLIEELAYEMHYAEVLGMRELYTALGLAFCQRDSSTGALCAAAVSAGIGVDLQHFNTTMLPVFLGQLPAGGALRQIIHFAQVLRFKRFARYNHNNPLTNLAVYGSVTPPEYDLSKITVPTYLHYAVKDFQTNYKDTILLGQRLPNTVGVYKIQRSSFNHFDYIWGDDVREQLYDRMIDMMREQEPGRR